MSALLGERALPVVQAPMAGGLSTVDLAAAVSSAGGLGFLAAGYRSAEQVEQDVELLRARTQEPFGVNLFVPSGASAPPAGYEPYLQRLAPVAREHGVQLGEPRFDDDWQRKVALLERSPVPVVSFVFGCPARELVGRLRAAGSEVWMTVTDQAEARAAAAAGADALVAQGHEAGAHRAAFDDSAAGEPLGLLALVALLTAEHPLPVVAAGGITTGAGLAAALAAGATAAQLGTAFLLCPEAGTSAPHRAAIRSAGATRLTRAFTGRRARAIENDFVRRFSEHAPSAYPQIHHATAPLRAAARAAGDADAMHLWAGQTHELARAVPAAELVAQLAHDAAAALAAAQRRLPRKP